jgi:ferredoxin
MKLRIPSFLIKPSTLEFTREARQTPGFSLFDWLHGQVYLRWPYLYIDIGTGEHALVKRFGPWVSRVVMLIKPRSIVPDTQELVEPAGENCDRERVTFADTYHGKVVPLESARQLVMVGEDISLPDLEHVIPYSRARDLILKNPDHITALECPCRVSRPNPCLPLDVCLIVGEPFASYIIEHHPDRSRWISQDEAVEILGAEEERGHVHHAFFKDAMLGRFYAICNCCSCCCRAMQAQRNGTPMLTSSGYVAEIDEALCIGCGTCEDLCQFSAISVPNGWANVDVTSCMGCGACCTNCEQGAVTLQLDPSKGAPLEIRKLMEQGVG